MQARLLKLGIEKILDIEIFFQNNLFK